jgi:hypothetical protein
VLQKAVCQRSASIGGCLFASFQHGVVNELLAGGRLLTQRRERGLDSCGIEGVVAHGFGYCDSGRGHGPPSSGKVVAMLFENSAQGRMVAHQHFSSVLELASVAEPFCTPMPPQSSAGYQTDEKKIQRYRNNQRNGQPFG